MIPIEIDEFDAYPLHDGSNVRVPPGKDVIAMQAGGDGYAEFAKGTDVKDTGIRLRDVVSDYIKAKKTVTPVNDGRIQIVN